MSENVKQSLSYSLGIVHGTKNVLSRILNSINQREPITSGKLIVHFAQLIGALNETDIVKENGKFIINDRGQVDFDWLPDVRALLLHEFNETP